ncbi:tRNA uridine-5-carboxymethylaminomethyl(34) synthesis GTPase MnmE [Psittacicella gerlachiana]|uniref:tRNA modification GTPase MnmE n=1 Tax=Psittacicella gerlachiana TaxID=2028574 RepID=A0A3A1YCZ6_9GAMM|nr:tRNA uridine-5-carboxymethylaminomethyl(34) synthesis GTPase MnmE [Psittacicella gerlachiana]RIY36022.1 tRNA uridine-5-carboxymethylaminomethyl(34) synthesis GTPase MnmE [Psittacicella gerlachiana]
MSNNTETIVAQATAIGRGSVGIIRVSGPNAKEIAKKITRTDLKPRYATYLPFYTDGEQPLDYGLAIFFPNPHSFTGEDVIEFQGHGGPVVQQALQEFIVSTNLARYAQPGEFSQQAFMNGKMDLVQAEAIADLINANSLQAAKGAINSLQGAFSDKVTIIVNELIHLRTYLEAGMDFPDEEIDILADSFVQKKLYSLQNKLLEIKNSAQQGKILRDGINAVIVGQPNAGKSSLLNALSGEQSAIVTEIAGTTRDTLKEFIQIDGLPLHIIDTAGLRETTDKVELIGIERAYQAMEKADVIIIVSENADFTKELALLPESIFEKDISKILITNKIDQRNETPWSNKQGNVYSIGLSAQTQAGLDLLKNALKEIIGYNNSSEGTIIARQRHLQAISQALEYFNNASFYMRQGVSPELIADDLRMAQQKLSEITGRFTADDLLTSIFSTFCIGK